MSKLEPYRRADQPLPAQYEAWQVFGAGMENVGRDGKPVTLPLREPAGNEILVRVDVLGLCLSDMKIIKQGGQHARLRGRDLANDPTVLGHECACTVVKAGARWKDRFRPGQRYIVQADIYIDGVSFAFGYMIPGGLAEYAYADERVLDGDEGCYLLPVDPATGYSQSALAEPWACVEMSYSLDDRLSLKAGGKTLIVADSPAEVDLQGMSPGEIAHTPPSADRLPEGPFDDIVIVRPTPETVTAAGGKLAKNGNLWLLGEPAADGPATLDVGAIHYENKRVFGGGNTLAEALGQHPKVFSELYINMVHAGEVSGSLDAVMERLADFTESELETRNKIVSAMAYPAIMIVVGVAVVIVLLTFVIPRFTMMFEEMDQQLPAITLLLVGISNFLKFYWWVLLGGAILLGVLYRRYNATPEGRLQVDTFKLRIPLVSDFLRKREIAKFARTMGTLLANGVPILKTLEIVEAVMSNKVLAQQIVNVRENIREGEKVSDRLGEGGVFPPMVVNMVAIGEETGSLEQTLDRIARAYEGDTERAMRSLTTMIEPLLILLMGGVVGFIVIAMILPIFMLSTSLR